ncbi:MAG: glycosyltransferase [Fibrobacter sp.]|nr:glycosyltransferase [Fibrobacter sp.]
MNKKPEVSIVIPVRNEIEALPRLMREMEQAISSIKETCEILIIDDHSNDSTPELVKNIVLNSDCKIRLVLLKNEQGKDWALAEGFRQAQGSIIITLDGDGQNDPADIPMMLKSLKNNAMVCGIRKIRHDPIAKKLASLIANKFRILITRDSIQDVGCALRIMRKDSARYLYPAVSCLNGAAHCFFPTILEIHGLKVTQITVRHRERFAGSSKFSLANGRIMNGLKGCYYVLHLRSRLHQCNNTQ